MATFAAAAVNATPPHNSSPQSLSGQLKVKVYTLTMPSSYSSASGMAWDIVAGTTEFKTVVAVFIEAVPGYHLFWQSSDKTIRAYTSTGVTELASGDLSGVRTSVKAYVIGT